MLVKVRLPRGAARRRIAGQQAPFLSGMSGLIILLAFSCLMLAIWRLTSDLGWTEAFVISDGFLSHWQVWMALAFAFGAAGMRLNRFSQLPEHVALEAPVPDNRAAAGRAVNALETTPIDAEDLAEPQIR